MARVCLFLFEFDGGSGGNGVTVEGKRATRAERATKAARHVAASKDTACRSCDTSLAGIITAHQLCCAPLQELLNAHGVLAGRGCAHCSTGTR